MKLLDAHDIKSLARSILSTSTRDLPVSIPFARRNVYAIAPPISIWLARPRKFSISSILSDTFEPPTIDTYGRAAWPRAWPRHSSSFCMRNPAAAGRTYSVMPAVDAWRDAPFQRHR